MNKILNFITSVFKSSASENTGSDGVTSFLDGYDVHIENISSEGFELKVNAKTVPVKWSTIEFVVAYRTNKIKNSPIHIDLWTAEGGTYPLHSTMKGWKDFIDQLPACLTLQNFSVLQTMPWTSDVMKELLFALLYDTQGRSPQEIYNSKYAQNVS